VILYLDTSALAKLFIAEPGSQHVAAAVGSSLAAATHRIAYVEMHATLAKAVRTGRIETSTLEPRLREFEDRWASLEVVEATQSLVRRAAGLAIRYGLRGYDSVHLAAALAVHESMGESVAYGFAATDGHLNEAARRAGLPLLTFL
jgi:predicted nucleic acid-binding protein